jgi:hypothetical protein
MSKVSRESATQGGDFGPVLDRNDEIDGYHVGFTLFRENVDGTPLLKGLPDDMCHCPHWGYVVSGKVTFRFPDRDETYEAGDAFYTPPGHIPIEQEPGSEWVMFSPADKMKVTMDTMLSNFRALQPAP